MLPVGEDAPASLSSQTHMGLNSSSPLWVHREGDGGLGQWGSTRFLVLGTLVLVGGMHHGWDEEHPRVLRSPQCSL